MLLGTLLNLEELSLLVLQEHPVEISLRVTYVYVTGCFDNLKLLKWVQKVQKIQTYDSSTANSGSASIFSCI